MTQDSFRQKPLLQFERAYPYFVVKESLQRLFWPDRFSLVPTLSGEVGSIEAEVANSAPQNLIIPPVWSNAESFQNLPE
jgi:hypothetical protein